MIATSAAAVGYASSGHQGVVARITAAVAAAMARRAKARQEYRKLLERDDILRDVGVSRDDVRRALVENGGRV